MADKIIPFSRFNRPKTAPAPIGDGTAPIYEERVVDGARVLVEAGTNPLNEFVQASLEETRIYNIINRYQRGDVSVLNKSGGQFMDVVGMPTNLAEAQNALLTIERQFAALPGEVKEKFGNNVNEFVQVVSEGKLNDVLKEFQLAPESEPNGGDVNEK